MIRKYILPFFQAFESLPGLGKSESMKKIQFLDFESLPGSRQDKSTEKQPIMLRNLSLLILLVSFLTTSCNMKKEWWIKSTSIDNTEIATGINPESFFFTWKMGSTNRNVTQSAYQIQLADNPKFVNSIWDSGKRSGDESILVNYGGEKLHAGQTYYWRVKAWDNKGNESKWSEVKSFTTGLFTEEEWSGAKWIAYDTMPAENRLVPGIHLPGKSWRDKELGLHKLPILRKEFQVKGGLKQALVFVSGLGHYEMSLNGGKVGDHFLAPGWTHYDESALYNTFDCTSQLKAGKNALGVMLGNGFFIVPNERYRKAMSAYGNPMMKLRLKLVYEDGTVQEVVSDESWKASPGPITFSSIYGGENYDARLDQHGWDQAGYGDSGWQQAVEVSSPAKRLLPERDYPVKILEEIQPTRITQIGGKEASYLYDFGQNASGVFELTVQGKAGDTVFVTPSELIFEDHSVNQNATGKPHYYAYILKSNEVETWQPRFSFYGFRYIQVDRAVPDEGNQAARLPKIKSLKMLHNRNSSPITGSFETSYGLFNRIDTLILWAIKSNFQSVLSDCPHREKLGWLEQSYLMGESVHFNFDIYHHYKKIIQDMIEAQTPEGLVPDIAPEYVLFDKGFRDSPEWGSAAVILPWLVYKWYGDIEPMKQAWPMMEKHVNYLKGMSTDNILDHGLGDWYDLGPERPGFPQLTPRALTATAIYFYDVKLMTEMAALIDRQAEVEGLNQWASDIKSAFNAKFFDPLTKIYSTGSQTAIAMPLVMGLVNAEDHDDVVQTLVTSIQNSKEALTAGDIGFNFLIKALQENGQGELLYKMNARDDVPGYGYQLKKGATALTESWPALEVVSNNHLMLGHLMEWFYNGLGGIGQAPHTVAYKEIVIDPQVVGGIGHTKASFDSPYGVISSEWFDSASDFQLNAEIPVNTSATLVLPAASESQIRESGEPIEGKTDFKPLGMTDGKFRIRVGSGVYRFTVKKAGL